MSRLVSSETSDKSFAIVTPTYAPDLVRCELLAESLDRVAPRVPHYLIVDRRDRPAFVHLQRGNRRIVDSEAIVGKSMWRTPGRKGFWLSLGSLPVRGWIIQQILKLGIVDVVSERTVVNCDSDVAFFRRFDRNNLLVNGRIGLLDVGYVDSNIRRWTSSARLKLGLPEQDGGYRCHVGNMICWNRETVIAMRQRVETSTGMDWQAALCRMSSFSEYMLYGVFVREALGYEAVCHWPSDVPLVSGSWGTAMVTDLAIEGFLANCDDRAVAVMVHSKDENDPSRLRLHLQKRWERLG
ncbi:MAG: DUF6492 family protein [Roseiarcus sp.]